MFYWVLLCYALLVFCSVLLGSLALCFALLCSLLLYWVMLCWFFFLFCSTGFSCTMFCFVVLFCSIGLCCVDFLFRFYRIPVPSVVLSLSVDLVSWDWFLLKGSFGGLEVRSVTRATILPTANSSVFEQGSQDGKGGRGGTRHAMLASLSAIASRLDCTSSPRNLRIGKVQGALGELSRALSSRGELAHAWFQRLHP